MGTEVAGPLGDAPGMPWLTTGPLWLLLILMLAAGAWWYWRRRFGHMPATRPDLQIQILATRALGPRNHLVVVETAGHRSLIATSAQGIRFLRDLPLPPQSPASDDPPFADHLDSGQESS